ncbi:hypothetical protein GBF38_012058, partial [Nibea albiflora]
MAAQPRKNKRHLLMDERALNYEVRRIISSSSTMKPLRDVSERCRHSNRKLSPRKAIQQKKGDLLNQHWCLKFPFDKMSHGRKFFVDTCAWRVSHSC